MLCSIYKINKSSQNASYIRAVSRKIYILPHNDDNNEIRQEKKNVLEQILNSLFFLKLKGSSGLYYRWRCTFFRFNNEKLDFLLMT